MELQPNRRCLRKPDIGDFVVSLEAKSNIHGDAREWSGLRAARLNHLNFWIQYEKNNNTGHVNVARMGIGTGN